MAPTDKAPRQVTAIHRGPDRYYPHLDATLHDGDEVPGVTAEQAAAAYYLELPDTPPSRPARAASPKERDD